MPPDCTIHRALDGTILEIRCKGRLKWAVGKTYAVQPGRTKPGGGFFTIKELLIEQVGDITDAEAVREGMKDRAEFFDVWKTLNRKFNPEQQIVVIHW